MAKRKKRTPLQQEYYKQRQRIQRGIKRVEKRGYILQKEILPPVPKKITKQSVSRLAKIKPETIYKNAVKLDIETGELVEGTKARNIERLNRKKDRRYNAKQEKTEEFEYDYTGFPEFADIVISNFRADIAMKFPKVAYPKVTTWLDQLLTRYSKYDVAQMLQDAAENGIMIDYSVAYNDELLNARLGEFLNFLPGVSQGWKEDIMEQLEYSEDWELPD